jgi:hypothetical protein
MAKDRLLFSIAVGKAAKLAPLPGTYTVARSMVEWGRAAGFRTFLISDEDQSGPVTCDRLKQVIQPELSQVERAIDHVIVHFTGHGFSRGGEQILLLNHWFENPDEAIHLPQLQRRCDRWDLQRVTLIIDACQSFESDETSLVDGSGILGRGSYDPNSPRFDTFFATRTGRPAYMLRGSDREPPVCLFSALILRALAGAAGPGSAVDRVRSWDVCNYIMSESKRMAGLYGLRQEGTCQVGFRPDEEAYAQLPLQGYAPPELPEPKAALAMAVVDMTDDIAGDASLMPTLPTTLQNYGLPVPDVKTAGAAGYQVATQVLRGIDAIGRGVDALNRARLRSAVRRRLRDGWNEPKTTAPAAAALLRLTKGGGVQRLSVAPGVEMIATTSTPPPQPLFRDGMIVGLRLSEGQVAPLQALQGTTTQIYLDSACPGGALLALDWQPADATPPEQRATLDLLIDLADNQLAPRGLSCQAPSRRSTDVPQFVRRQPMAALVRAYLANAAGDRDGVQAVADGFREVYGVFPFDLAILVDDPAGASLLGACPLFAAGWRLLEDSRVEVDPDLLVLGPKMVRGVPFAQFADASAAASFASILKQEG